MAWEVRDPGCYWAEVGDNFLIPELQESSAEESGSLIWIVTVKSMHPWHVERANRSSMGDKNLTATQLTGKFVEVRQGTGRM